MEVKMRCLVTGATGHIGSYLVRYIIERGAEVAVLLRPATTNLWRIEDVLHHLYTVSYTHLTLPTN